MDIKIDREKGDLALNSRGVPYFAEGLEELLQRAYIAIALPMGTLPGNPSFGGDRILVEKNIAENRAELGFHAMAENALASPEFMKLGVKLTSARLNDENTGGVIGIESDLGSGSFEVIL